MLVLLLEAARRDDQVESGLFTGRTVDERHHAIATLAKAALADVAAGNAHVDPRAIGARDERLDHFVGITRRGPAARAVQRVRAGEFLGSQRGVGVDGQPVKLLRCRVGFDTGWKVVIDASQGFNRARGLPRLAGGQPQLQPGDLGTRQRPADERFVNHDGASEVSLRLADFGLAEGGIFGQVAIDLAAGQGGEGAVGGGVALEL